MFIRLFSSQLVWLLIILYLFLWTELYEDSRTDWLFYCCSSLRIISFTYNSHEFGIPTSKSFVQWSEISHRQTQLRRPDGAPLGRKLLQVPSLSHPMTAVAAVRARPVRHFLRLAPPGLCPQSEPAHVTPDNASADTTSSGSDPSQSPSHVPRKRSQVEIYCD